MFSVTLEKSVSAAAIQVEDNFGQGWIFKCRGTNTRRFKALSIPQVLIATEYSARLLSKYSPKAIKECEEAGKRFIAEFADSEEGLDAHELMACLSEEAKELYGTQIMFQTQQAQRLAESEPPSAKGVASLIKGWYGILDEDGVGVPFSTKNVIALLSSVAPVPSGEYEGDEIGEALRRWIPSEIIRLTAEREAVVASNSKNSSAEPCGGNGSTTDQETKQSVDSGT